MKMKNIKTGNPYLSFCRIYICSSFVILLLYALLSVSNASPAILIKADQNTDYNGINYDHSIHNQETEVPDVNIDDIYGPPTEREQNIISLFDPNRLNYTALREAISDWMSPVSSNTLSNRQGRLLGKSLMPSFLSNIGRMFDIEQVVKEIETSIMSTVSCNACKAGMGLLQHYIKTGRAKHEMIDAASGLCTSFKFESPRVCYGIIKLMADEILYVAANVFMTPEEVCSFVIGDICGTPYNPYHNWKVSFPPIPKPAIVNGVNHREGHPTIKVLHLSDIHFDPYYEEGTNANCGEPLCCRPDSGIPKTENDRAGYWGDYRKCDTPRRTIYNMLEHITYVHPDIAYVIMTGDLPPHDVWNQTKESNVNVIQETAQQLRTYFPNTPIFPALGNHESAPVNSFPPSYVPKKFGVSWLYEELNKEWQHWLPNDTSKTVLMGGFYSVLVRPKFRIISINTNFCNNKNWWLLINSTDPAHELQWLIYELQGAELRKEKVHIIGHIPIGHADCLKIWSRNYYAVINRFESTITAQFFGHTHYDEFQVFYDLRRPWRAINIAYIGPSVTSYYGLNPGYRIYTLQGEYEGSTQMVIDHETWIMDLAEANRNGVPHWSILYTAKRDYRMFSLHPQEWDSLIYQMAENKELFDMYHRHYWKASPAREKCDSECRKRMLCDCKSGRSHDRAATCAKVNEKLEAKERVGWSKWLFSSLTLSSIAWYFWP